MYTGNQNKIKELPGIQQNRGSSNPRNTDENDLSGGYHYKKRNASGNTRNLISMHGLGTLNGQQYGQGSNGGAYHASNSGNSLTPSKVGKA